MLINRLLKVDLSMSKEKKKANKSNKNKILKYGQ